MFMNHLLDQNSWALQRLARFSGKSVRFEVAPFSFTCRILEDGSLLDQDAAEVTDARKSEKLINNTKRKVKRYYLLFRLRLKNS